MQERGAGVGVGEMLRRGWESNYITDGVSVGKKTVLVGDIDYMAKFMVAGNPNCLTEIVFDENFRGLVIDEVRK